MELSAQDFVEQIAKMASEKMAENILIMDMRRVSGVCDYFIIASATSNVRAKTIAEHIEKESKALGRRVVHREGFREGKWIINDFGDVVVHVFQNETRSYYSIEQLWGDAPRKVYQAS